MDLKLETVELTSTPDGVVVATLNRPDRYNAMTATMFTELERLAFTIADDPRVRVLVITGAGKGFCAGYDLAAAEELPSLTPMGMLDLQELGARALTSLRGLPVPVLAAVNGPAAGGGMALALAADIRLAATSAKFNAAFVRIGLSVGDLGTSWLLPRIVGPAAAAEIAYTGGIVDAATAERIGLVNRVVDDADLLTETLALASRIAANSPGAVRMSKRALQANQEIGSYAAAVELENRGQSLLTRDSNMAEALAAMKDKRTPAFTTA